MLKIAIDTNIVISGIIYGGKPYKILELVMDRVVLNVISSYIIKEIEGVLVRKFGWQLQKVKDNTNWLLEFSELVNPIESLNVLNYDNDNRILECAVAGKVQAIVTGDRKHLLTLKQYENILILNAVDFLTWIKKHYE
ncbi:MAG: putative toxin-antitoxin system toxin component, PIN family [Nitrospirae bacterium YQR-1]